MLPVKAIMVKSAAVFTQKKTRFSAGSGRKNERKNRRQTLNFELDAYDRKILTLMQEDARLSYSELGRRII
jgi:hypothetical protein